MSLHCWNNINNRVFMLDVHGSGSPGQLWNVNVDYGTNVVVRLRNFSLNIVFFIINFIVEKILEKQILFKMICTLKKLIYFYFKLKVFMLKLDKLIFILVF